MTTQELRKVLLGNANKMLSYAVSELANTSTPFCHKYEIGFIYGWSSYNISFSYSPKTKKARIAINWYRGSDYFFSSDGKAYDGHDINKDEDITNSFLTNVVWGDGKYMQQALEITQQHWGAIKSAIARHKEKENDILNFQV